MIALSDNVYLGGFGMVTIVLVVALVKNRSISATMGKILVKVDAVNKAVNDRDPGEPTISEQVSSMALDLKGVHDLVSAASGRISDNAAITLDHGRRLDVIEGKVATLEAVLVVSHTSTGEVPVTVKENP